MSDEPTEDLLLGGRVRLLQPERGYRAAIDPVLLAAAVPAVAGERVLDLGAGTGAAALCLAVRVEGISVTGLEVQGELADLANRSAAASGLAGRVEVLTGDLREPPDRLRGARFDQVMANPPYLDAARGHPPPDRGRATAHVEQQGGLDDWIAAAIGFLRPRGRLTLIHRADRLDHLLALLSGRLGDLVVFPLWPHADDGPAKRVILSGRAGLRSPLRLARGLVLHEADGAYTPRAQAVLRDAQPLELQP